MRNIMRSNEGPDGDKPVLEEADMAPAGRDSDQASRSHAFLSVLLHVTCSLMMSSHQSDVDESDLDPIDLDGALDAAGFGSFQLKAMQALILSQMVVGMETALWWQLPPLLEHQWELSAEELTTGQMACITFFSAGSLLAGHAADFYGRFVSLLFLDSAYMIMMLLSSIAPTAVFLLAFRCSCSLLAGGRLSCALPLAMEICPPRWRFGSALIVACVGANIGSLYLIGARSVLDAVLGESYSATLEWRLLLLSCAVVELPVWFLMRNQLCESLSFLYEEGMRGLCLNVLDYMAEENGQEVRFTGAVSLVGGRDEAEAQRRRERRGLAKCSITWVACAVCSGIVAAELMEDESVVLNMAGSEKGKVKILQLALLHVSSALFTLTLWDQVNHFDLVHFVCIVPAIVLGACFMLIPPFHGLVSLLFGALLFFLIMALHSLSLALFSTFLPSKSRCSSFGGGLCVTSFLHLLTLKLSSTFTKSLLRPLVPILLLLTLTAHALLRDESDADDKMFVKSDEGAREEGTSVV
ncbi:hypothetical protein GUITHDRAFT_111073 [Guillardia theta CCMP2712]|uniref:Major facilitator superfamily (MFS) profile domain-containing protein n=2 Tax=Guillardia theta TaxID=55529 RepID=L1J3E1_GUITC|nr:hypothetical protein GUITHDRAFT_111073 [Guillardia theta CCMP2712]EKX43031.1 hypothetical protein GUITHDRAFT_111073 [Guillardia theta CCMP2712]|eukprot:XP_005830011.1 hypothetical protein GUITHDRAFT_111073 [Guillardia theta CCMP2712]